MTASNVKPRLIVIAGPNGAGKSTFTNKTYSELIENTAFINPDEIALQIVTLYPGKTTTQQQVQAGRTALKAYTACFAQRKSFTIETTLAGNSPLKIMQKAQ